jgi:outer membrane protein
MKRLILSTLAVIVLFSATAFSQTLKIGIVDIETIVSEMPEAKKAEASLTSLGKKYQDTVMQMRTELETKVAAYQKQQAMMPADQKQKEEEALQLLNMEVSQYYEKHFGQMGTLVMKREQLLEPIRKSVKDAIDAVATAEKINLVLDKNQQIVLYSEEKMDITFRVLDQLKRGSGK